MDHHLGLFLLSIQLWPQWLLSCGCFLLVVDYEQDLGERHSGILLILRYLGENERVVHGNEADCVEEVHARNH